MAPRGPSPDPVGHRPREDGPANQRQIAEKGTTPVSTDQVAPFETVRDATKRWPSAHSA